MKIVKVCLPVFFVLLLIVPVYVQAWDLSFSSIKTVISDYVSSVRKEPSRIFPVAFFGGLAAILGYTIYKHQTMPAVVKYLEDEDYLKSGVVYLYDNLVLPGQKISFSTSSSIEDEEQEDEKENRGANDTEITVQQLKVFSQRGEYGGGYASCGYHTVKNLLALNHILSNPTISQKDAKKLLDNYENIKRYFGNRDGDQIGCWRKNIVDNRKKTENNFNKLSDDLKKGDWLEAEEVENLLTRGLDYGKEDAVKNYTVVKNIDLLINCRLTDSTQKDNYLFSQLPQNVPTLNFLAKMSMKKQPYIHLFAVSTANESSTYGHWFGVVLRATQASREYTVVDSLNNVLLYGDGKHDCLKKLIGYIEGDSNEDQRINNVDEQIKAPDFILRDLEHNLDTASPFWDQTQTLLDRYERWGGNADKVKGFRRKFVTWCKNADNEKHSTK